MTQKGIIWFLIVSADIIFVLEIASLFQVLDKPILLIVIQWGFALLTVLINKILKAGFPKLQDFLHIIKNTNFLQTLKSNRILRIFIFFISLNLVLLAVCIVKFPQNITDILYNHLSRVGYWIQQGSLQHYSAFNIVGMTYPYNNSLLMALPIILLKSDRLVGFVQFFAGLVCVISCYCISRMIGHGRNSSLLAAIALLTYPIIIYQSITSQNDLLIAAYIAGSFALLISYLSFKRTIYIISSFLSLVLAIGTKQYAIIFLSGYLCLFLYIFFVSKSIPLKIVPKLVCTFILFQLFFGSYANVQNMIHYGNPFGPKVMTESALSKDYLQVLPKRIVTNSSRYFLQFISCEGIPPQVSTACVDLRTRVLKPMLAKNIETDQYLYTYIPFQFQKEYLANAESAWFGPVCWLLILPGIIGGVIIAIKKRKPWQLLFLMIPISYFFLLQIIVNGWEPYQGRFFISSIVLLQPFTAWIFESKNYFHKILVSLICLMAVFVMGYATVNNASLPLVSKNMFVGIEKWGQSNNPFVQKIAYKIKPFIISDKDVWSMNRTEIMVIGESAYYDPVSLIEENVPQTAKLGIVSDAYDLPDYLFRGTKILRSLYKITPKESDTINLEYILLSPQYKDTSFTGYKTLKQLGGWVLLIKQLN